jgi:hypothetical protein
MVDRTKDFFSIVQVSPIFSSFPVAPILLPPLFLIKAGGISKQIDSFSDLIRKWRVPYIDYHRYFRCPSSLYRQVRIDFVLNLKQSGSMFHVIIEWR